MQGVSRDKNPTPRTRVFDDEGMFLGFPGDSESEDRDESEEEESDDEEEDDSDLEYEDGEDEGIL